jgi:glutamyl-tRNA reductase
MTLRSLRHADSVGEAILVSTCNRVEVYAETDDPRSAVSAITRILAEQASLSDAELSGHLYVLSGEAAVGHLLTVAAGLDSMFVGEAQILGQLRSAYALGIELDTVGTVLHGLLQSAFRVGKRVHSETGIDRAGASVVAGALDRAEQAIGPLCGKRVIIVGAGSTGALSGATLRQRGVNDIVVLNRSPERAARLATTLGGLAAPLSELQTAIGEADIVIASTGSTDLVIDAQMIGERMDRPIVVLDLARPHDVDPVVAQLPGVTYFDLDGLYAASQTASVDDLRAAERIVAAELVRYQAMVQRRAVASVITALRAQAKRILDAELQRLEARNPNLARHERDAVIDTVRRAMEKLIHVPTVRMKELSTTPGSLHYAATLCELFDLRLEPTSLMLVAGAAG